MSLRDDGVAGAREYWSRWVGSPGCNLPSVVSPTFRPRKSQIVTNVGPNVNWIGFFQCIGSRAQNTLSISKAFLKAVPNQEKYGKFALKLS